MIRIPTDAAVRAIHDLNVVARAWSHEGRDARDVTAVLDEIDYLTTLMLEPVSSDGTEAFVQTVQESAARCGEVHIWDRFTEHFGVRERSAELAAAG